VWRAIGQALLSYTPEDHPDCESIRLAVEKVKNVVKFIEEKRKRAENIQDVLRVQDSVVGKSVEMEVRRLSLPIGPLLPLVGNRVRAPNRTWCSLLGGSSERGR
jgi:hypothetical protein